MLSADGKNVFAHSRRPEAFGARGSFPLDQFPDRVLADLATAEPIDELGIGSIKAYHTTGVERGRGYVYLTKLVSISGSSPFILGIYFPGVEVMTEIQRTLKALVAGLAGLVLAVIAAMLLGTWISKPMSRIAVNAIAFSDFRLQDIAELPRSRIREIDDQAVALNTLGKMMAEFTLYVPRKLVGRLMRSGAEAKRPVEREVTVMFTDIVGFTSISERLSAAETASLLNRHFDLLAGAVSATGGTVDKFMGDAMMAFWGAPGADDDQARHALQAATAIASGLDEENAERRRTSQPPLRVRVGIHCGRVLVGHIGGGDRQNYTVVGDVVNIAQRLEQMGRELITEQDDIVVLASDAVARKAGPDNGLEPAGTRILRGRERPVQVRRLALGRVGPSNIVPLAANRPA